MAPMEEVRGMSLAMKRVVEMFLDVDHYRRLNRVLSQQWQGCHSLTAAMRLMEAHGIKITPEEERRLAQLPEDMMIDSLVSRMPQQSREQFEHFFLQLSFIASTTEKLRTALESGNTELVQECMDSAENIGVTAYIIKMVVAQAGLEVKANEDEHDAWLAETENRVGPMLSIQAQAAKAKRQLEQAQAVIGDYRSSAKEKSKAMMMGLVSNNERALLDTIMTAWLDHVKFIKMEGEILKECNYEEELEAAQKELVAFRDKQLGGVKSMMNKSYEDAQRSCLATVFAAFREEVEDSKRAKQAGSTLQTLQTQLKDFSNAAASNAKKVMMSMNAGNEENLKGMLFQEWVNFIIDYKKEKEVNDAVKAAEQKFNAMKKEQNDGAMKMLTSMTAATEAGLLQSVFKGWHDTVMEEKESRKIEEALEERGAKLAGLAGRSKSTAMNATERYAHLQDMQLLIFIFCHWKREVKVEVFRRYGKEKNNKRKQELMGVKGLFKDFAGKLETTLKEGTPRADGSVPSSKSRGTSLPAPVRE